MYNTTGIHRHSCISMFRDDIGHVSQALFSQVPYYQAFDWEFIVDHQDRHRWFELQWIHMVDLLYWKSVFSSHRIYDFQDMVFEHGYYQHSNSWNLGTGPDYYSELVPRVLSTWDSWVIVLGVQFSLISSFWIIYWNIVGINRHFYGVILCLAVTRWLFRE